MVGHLRTPGSLAVPQYQRVLIGNCELNWRNESVKLYQGIYAASSLGSAQVEGGKGTLDTLSQEAT